MFGDNLFSAFIANEQKTMLENVPLNEMNIEPNVKEL